ncbi:C39 family peptidase [Thalassolituus alkanivorans]|uniref:C39 family peptidase n=1 Tax=Thalassolituus alkanivorans TaxID=2881055 RepID=UPI001E3DCB6A|nr:C39 family peptidase [Thalassolituus alkanivorans]MCB2387585.1 C39 family peptidase [Thalassolituus alkanivorans]MCB2425267.1 C39 family peptidase [Thalassolituus alkanivorans]
MFIILLGSIIGFAMVHELAIVNDRQQGDAFVRVAVNEPYQYDQLVNVEPLSVKKFNNIVRQAYDYSCGSAALTTLLDFYLGRNFQERQVMEGLLRFGETERIVQRRGFSLLDMKRLVTALGHPSGGFKAEAKDLLELDHPAIAPIEYAGFKHFVVIRAVYENRVYLADPALGNISFTLSRFLEIWDNNVLFIVFPNGHKPASGLELREEDMRYVSDFIIAENSYKEFPLMAMKYEDAIGNEIASMSNNAKSSFVPQLDASGKALRDEDGNVKYEIKLEDAADGVSSDEFNVRVTTDDPNERLVKELRFRRK